MNVFMDLITFNRSVNENDSIECNKIKEKTIYMNLARIVNIIFWNDKSICAHKQYYGYR